MSREECRHSLLSELDRAAAHPWVIGQQGVSFAKALRELVITDDSLVDRINAVVHARYSDPESPGDAGGE
jgi:hypothetical protein